MTTLRVSWPPNPEVPLELGQRPYAGVIYTITRAPNMNDSRREFQQLHSHFWSSVFQTPLYKLPIAIVVQDKADILLPLIPTILRIHQSTAHFQPYLQYFAKAAEGEHWIKICIPKR